MRDGIRLAGSPHDLVVSVLRAVGIVVRVCHFHLAQHVGGHAKTGTVAHC